MHFDSNPLHPNSEQTISQQNIGQMFSKHPANYYQNKNSKILLFCLDYGLGVKVRSALRQFTSEYFESADLADGGNLSDIELQEKLIGLFDSAVYQDKTIVLLGAKDSLIRSFQDLWSKHYHPLRASFITDRCSPLLNLDLDSIYLKECHAIGFQRQHPFIADKSIHYIRLGEYRNNPAVIEPALRRSEIVYFNLSSIRSGDSPGNLIKNPSGFTAEEASAISRSIGISERLKIFAISSWDDNNDPDQITSNLVAQMVWYFYEGCHLKKLDTNYDKKNLTQYLVEIKNLDYVISFYKSEKSGKWWFEEPLVDNEFSNQLIPCSYEEYLSTVNDQIPERILEMINE